MTVSLSEPGVTRSVIGAGLYLTVLGLFALAIGALVRHSAGAIAIVIGLVLVLAPLLACSTPTTGAITCTPGSPPGGRLHHP